MQKRKRRSLTLMILGTLALALGLVWMAHDATTVMAHPCADGSPAQHDPVDGGNECDPHTSTPRPTSTPTPRPTNTSTPRPTSTSIPSRTLEPTPTTVPTDIPTNTPALTNTPAPTSTAMPTATSTAMPRPAAAPRPSTPCIVTHAATPAQLCVTDEGIQYYFIGPDRVQTGPYLSSFSELAETHSLVQAVVELYRGTNPMTGKPVHIDYLPNEKVIRVSTYYADTPYSKNKPYIFTVNTNYEVTHQAW